jgi:hypothetical protein
MKNILFLFSLFVSTLVVADIKNDTQTFVFDGSELSKVLTLNDAVYRTEYRVQQRPAICYRTVVISHNTVCSNVQTGTVCSNVNGRRVCRPVYTRQCRQNPVYGRQAFTCYQNVTVAHQVLDHYSQANVKFTFSEVPEGLTPYERITLRLDDQTITSSTKSSGKVAMIFNKQETTQMDGRNIIKNVHYAVRLLDLQKALSPSRGGIKLIDSSADELVFEAGSIPADFGYVFNMKITKRRFLAKDPVIVDSVLSRDAMEIEELNGRTLIKVKLEKLKAQLEKGKYKVKFSIALDLSSARVLNSDIPSLNFRMSKKFKIK